MGLYIIYDVNISDKCLLLSNLFSNSIKSFTALISNAWDENDSNIYPNDWNVLWCNNSYSKSLFGNIAVIVWSISINVWNWHDVNIISPDICSCIGGGIITGNNISIPPNCNKECFAGYNWRINWLRFSSN